MAHFGHPRNLRANYPLAHGITFKVKRSASLCAIDICIYATIEFSFSSFAKIIVACGPLSRGSGISGSGRCGGLRFNCGAVIEDNDGNWWMAREVVCKFKRRRV